MRTPFQKGKKSKKSYGRKSKTVAVVMNTEKREEWPSGSDAFTTPGGVGHGFEFESRHFVVFSAR